MTIARYLSKFAKSLTSDGKMIGSGISTNTLDSNKFESGVLYNYRNRIINGDMRIAQRGTSFAVANAYPYTLDRFGCGFSGTSAATITQSTDVPAGSGLSNSLRATVTTTDTSIAAGDHSFFYQIIEGYNVADLVGVPITLSFWVRSSKTGIHCFRFSNSAEDRSYVSEYTISSSNTWEKKSITIANGLITSGTWNFTNGKGLYIAWALAFGTNWQTATPNNWTSGSLFTTPNQVNCLDTVGNIFAITGVQLEKGSVASEFEFRPYSVELSLCQRYYEIVGGTATPSNGAYFVRPYKVKKRAAPTLTLLSGSTGGANFDDWIDPLNCFRLPGNTNATIAADFSISAAAEY